MSIDTSSKSEEYFELNQRGINYKIFVVDKVSLDSILAGKDVVKLGNSIFQDNSMDVFKLEDDRVVVVREGENEFPIYPSETILLNQILDFAQNSPEEILEGINTFGEGFAKIAKDLAYTFLHNAKIDLQKENTLQILEDVDLIISKNRNKRFFNENYLSLIALLGELINKEFGSSWKMVKSEKNGIWTPCLSYRGRNIFFADYILMDFDNKNVNSPIILSYMSITDIIKFQKRR